eukprot:5067826-Prymnesium_polylepis.1
MAAPAEADADGAAASMGADGTGGARTRTGAPTVGFHERTRGSAGESARESALERASGALASARNEAARRASTQAVVVGGTESIPTMASAALEQAALEQATCLIRAPRWRVQGSRVLERSSDRTSGRLSGRNSARDSVSSSWKLAQATQRTHYGGDLQRRMDNRQCGGSGLVQTAGLGRWGSGRLGFGILGSGPCRPLICVPRTSEYTGGWRPPLPNVLHVRPSP